MKKIILVVVALIITNLAISQTASPELISSSGDSFSNSNFQLDWSIGEILTETYQNSENILTQGFHQNNYIITSIEDLRTDIEISVYPNPTSNFVSLTVESPEVQNLKYIISDITGKILKTSDLQNETEQINFSDYSVGTYLITIVQTEQALSQQKLIKSFKIIKN